MIKPEQVPKETIEAARKFMRLQALSDEWIDDLLAAALNAWPGKDIVGYGPPFYGIELILPLTTQENENE